MIATTRFPADAASRFEDEPDFRAFQNRLHVYGLDMRSLEAVERFCSFVRERYSHLDAIINNACQTIRRPPAYYNHLLEGERRTDFAVASTGSDLPDVLKGESAWRQSQSCSAELAATSTVEDKQALPSVCSAPAYAMSQIATLGPDDVGEDTSFFPVNALDVNKQQLDLRRKTSWTLKLDEVQTPEVCEVMAVNAIAPFILNGKLKPMLKASPNQDRYVINVSAMEGKFYRHKDVTHPHTNMAKAALNMMTRTSAADYAKDGIYMNAVCYFSFFFSFFSFNIKLITDYWKQNSFARWTRDGLMMRILSKRPQESLHSIIFRCVIVEYDVYLLLILYSIVFKSDTSRRDRCGS